jgi:hypothetical protein
MGLRLFDFGDSFLKGVGFLTLTGGQPRSLFAIFWHVEERRLEINLLFIPIFIG